MWVKANLVDDWGHKVYVLGKVVRSSFGTVSIKDQTSPVLKAGEYTVKFKDGTEKKVKVKMKPYEETVSDHGHDYSVGGELPYFEIDVHGSKVEISPENVKWLVKK